MFNFKYLNYPNGCKVYDILIVKKEHLGKNKLDIQNKVKYIKDGINKNAFYSIEFLIFFIWYNSFTI